MGAKNIPYQKIVDAGTTTIVYISLYSFVPEDKGNIDYQNFESYLKENNLTIDDIADYNP